MLQESLVNNHGLDFNEKVGLDGSTRFHGVKAPIGPLTICYEATLERTNEVFKDAWTPWEANLVELPSAVAPFLYPSRYCESDKLTRLAAKEFGRLSPGHSRVAAICNWIHENIDYLPGSTNEHSSAVECLTSRAGVCRDFAHLGIAFCRALGIPARYVSAYVFQLPSPDFHACIEVWLGDRWWYYDATRLAPQEGFLLIGTGHDAADTSFATMSMGLQFSSMELSVEKKSPRPLGFTTSPISFWI